MSCEVVPGQTSADVRGKEGATELAILDSGKVGTSINARLCEVIVWQNNLCGNVKVQGQMKKNEFQTIVMKVQS